MIAFRLFGIFSFQIWEIFHGKFERFTKNALTQSIFELEKCCQAQPTLNSSSTSTEAEVVLISTSPATHPATHPPGHPATRKSTITYSMSAISQLLLAKFWLNSKYRFLGPPRTDFNCNGNICPGDICPGDICPYQEYLSWYWPDFEIIWKIDSWDHLE